MEETHASGYKGEDSPTNAKRVTIHRRRASDGELPTEKASPKYGFGSGGRTKATFTDKEIWPKYGKWGPGPKYKLHENTRLDQPPKFSIGNSPRNSTNSPRYYSSSYDYFDENTTANDPIDTNDCKIKTMPKHSFMALGTETRMFTTLKSITPGAKYNP